MNFPKATENMLNYMKTNDISCRLNNDLAEDPNKNYTILHELMKTAKAIHFPVKYVKFHKHRHEKNNWITPGIKCMYNARSALKILVHI